MSTTVAWSAPTMLTVCAKGSLVATPPKVQIHIRMTLEQQEWLVAQAEHYRTTMTELVNALIDSARSNPATIPDALRARRNL